MIAAYGAAKAVLRPGDPPVWRILAGRENSEDAAEALAKRIAADMDKWRDLVAASAGAAKP